MQSPSKNCILRAANFNRRSWLAGNLPFTTSSQNYNKNNTHKMYEGIHTKIHTHELYKHTYTQTYLHTYIKCIHTCTYRISLKNLAPLIIITAKRRRIIKSCSHQLASWRKKKALHFLGKFKTEFLGNMRYIHTYQYMQMQNANHLAATKWSRSPGRARMPVH